MHRHRRDKSPALWSVLGLFLDVTNTGNGERGTGNGERGTGNGSLGTNVQRQPA